MVDSVFNQSNLKENSYFVKRRIEEITAKGGIAICNVVTKYDLPNGYDVSISSFSKLSDAEEYLKKSFIEICKSWVKEIGFNNIEELIEDSSSETQYSLQDTTAHLYTGDSYLTMYITINQLQ